jgi:hypothetical protein
LIPSYHDGYHRSTIQKSKPIRKSINRALRLHNYAFRNLEKYKTLRSKRGEARRVKELSREDNLPPHIG